MRKVLHFVVWVAGILLVVTGALRLTVLRWWRVPDDDPYLTSSLSPSLRGGDWILLWRGTKPHFGDLVLCPEPKQPDRVVIARLVGESNDEITVKGSEIIINGQRQRTEANCANRKFVEREPASGIEVEQSCELEELGGSLHARGNVTGSGFKPHDVSTTVPAGSVWLVSDNRLFPYDSRDFGAAPQDSCREMVFFRVVGAGGFFDVESRLSYIP